MRGEKGQDKNGAVDKSDGTAQNAEMSSAALAEWIKNWPIVLASFIGIGLCLSPLPYYAVIILGPEFGKEFGWDRVTIQTGLLFMTAGVLMGAPIAGSLTDQFGTRRVLLPAIIALGILTASFGFMNANPIIYYAIFYLTAILGAGTLPLTWSKAIVNNFDKTRGLALGIALTGTGVYGFLAPPFIQDIAHTINWRAAYFCVGALPILLSFPLAFFIFKDRREAAALDKMSHNKRFNIRALVLPIVLIIAVFVVIVSLLQAVGVIITALFMLLILFGLIFYELRKEKTNDTIDLPGLTLNQAVRGYHFWVIIIAFMVLGACISGIIANLKFILLDKGYSSELAASRVAGLGLIGLSVIFGRLIGGYIVDHVWAPLVAFIFMSVPALGCYFLMQDLPQSYNSVAIILIGIAAGVEFDLMAFLVSRYLGMRAYGRIYSFVYAAFGLGSGTAPAIFNAIKGDAINYNSVLIYTMWGCLFGATILLSLGKYRDFTTKT